MELIHTVWPRFLVSPLLVNGVTQFRHFPQVHFTHIWTIESIYQPPKRKTVNTAPVHLPRNTLIKKRYLVFKAAIMFAIYIFYVYDWLISDHPATFKNKKNG